VDDLGNLIQGFGNLFTFDALLWCVIGVLVGTLIGALPGLGPVAGIAVLLPLCFTLDTVPALMLLMGVYQGALYGGRVSSILINVPGEPTAVVATFEGYPMTRQGRAGYALSLSAIACFVGGMIGFIGLVVLMPYLSAWGLLFGPPEMFALMVFALVTTSGLGSKNLLKGLISLGIGLLVATIGLDQISGEERMTFGTVDLWDGVSFVAVAVGLFGMSEVLELVLNRYQPGPDLPRLRMRELLPNGRDLGRNTGAILRGSVIGYIVGALPGAGATIATFMSYSTEKRFSKTPEKFGTGVDQGLSGPEAAGNASIGGSLVPLFTLGIPGGAITAVLLGALITLGLEPGPRMLERSGDVVWTTIAGLFLANVLLLVFNTAFVPAFATLIRAAQPYLASLIAALCVLGVYLESFRFFDVAVMLFFGILGYFMRRFDIPLAPLILAVVLGPMIETSLRQSLLMSASSPEIFVARPITLVLLVATVGVLLLPAIRGGIRRARPRTAAEDRVLSDR
jgi:putative tricarboxylic transport membrane protein